MTSASRRSRSAWRRIVVTTEKVDRINRAVDEAKARRLDELTLKSTPAASCPKRDHGETPLAKAREHKAAFDTYVRKGESQGAFERSRPKAMSVGSGPDGGFLVPPEVETQIGPRLYAISPIRAIAGVRSISRPRLQEAVHDGRACGWLGGRDRRAHADHVADARRVVVPGHGLYAMPAATATLLETPRSISTSGWRRRSSWSSPRRRAPPSSPATAPTSEGLPRLYHGRQRRMDLGQSRLSRVGLSAALSRPPTIRHAGRSGLCGERRLPAERTVRDEPQAQSPIRKFKDTAGNYLWQPAARRAAVRR